jgi:hypothetical protein
MLYNTILETGETVLGGGKKKQKKKTVTTLRNKEVLLKNYDL